MLVPPKKVLKKKKLGAEWIDTPSAQITDEVKRDLSILKMRDTLDPKRFYKVKMFQILKEQSTQIVQANCCCCCG